MQKCRVVQYDNRTKIFLAFRIGMKFKAATTNKVYKSVKVRAGRKCLRPVFFKLVILRLFEANVASKVTY